MAQVNLSTEQKKTHRHREQTCDWKGGGGGGSEMDCESGVSKCKLVHKEQLSNVVLLCSTEYYV